MSPPHSPGTDWQRRLQTLLSEVPAPGAVFAVMRDGAVPLWPTPWRLHMGDPLKAPAAVPYV